MKTIAVSYPDSWESLELHCFADLHLGDLLVDGQHLMDRIKRCEETERCAVILNGDLMNNATRNSISDTYSEVIPPMRQIERCCELFSKLAEQKKIIAITTGNHERRTDKDSNIDLTEIVAAQLGLSDRFSKGSALIFLRFGESRENGRHHRKQLYTVFCSHGSGGGSLIGGKASRLVNLASICDADIFYHSHTHEPMIIRQGFVRLSTSTNSVLYVDRLFINTASELSYGGYGEVKGMRVASKETPVVYLSGTKRNMYAKL